MLFQCTYLLCYHGFITVGSCRCFPITSYVTSALGHFALNQCLDPINQV